MSLFSVFNVLLTKLMFFLLLRNFLSNTFITVEFDKDGLLSGVTTKDDGVKTKTKVEFVEYSTKTRGDKSESYLFLYPTYLHHVVHV